MEVQKAEVDNILNHWKRDKSNLIEMLEDVQEHYRHIPPEVAITIAEELDISMNRIFHIATFYKGFTLEPRGKYPISVCTGTACHVKGGTRILENIMRDLDLEKEGQATKDQLFSVESVRCIGCCGLAPVVAIGGKIHGKTSSMKMKKAIDKVRKKEQAQ